MPDSKIRVDLSRRVIGGKSKEKALIRAAEYLGFPINLERLLRAPPQPN